MPPCLETLCSFGACRQSSDHFSMRVVVCDQALSRLSVSETKRVFYTPCNVRPLILSELKQIPKQLEHANICKCSQKFKQNFRAPFLTHLSATGLSSIFYWTASHLTWTQVAIWMNRLSLVAQLSKKGWEEAKKHRKSSKWLFHRPISTCTVMSEALIGNPTKTPAVATLSWQTIWVSGS